MANKPLILSDNFVDDVVLHPDHIITHTNTPVTGSEVWQLADNLRDLTRFTVAETNTATQVRVDCGVAKSVDIIALDRGHNLKGKTVKLWSGTDGVTWPTLRATCVVPAAPGGLATDANGCLTPDGVWWKSVASASQRGWMVEVPAMGAGLAPILTGLYLGKSYRFPEYLDAPAAYDYRVNHRVQKNDVSRGGVRIKRGIVNYAEVDLAFKLEGVDFAAFYPEAKRLLFSNHPWWFCLDDADVEGCGLMRLFQLPGDTVFDPQVNPVHREIRLLLEEVAPTLTL
jgi:hypothetical protein